MDLFKLLLTPFRRADRAKAELDFREQRRQSQEKDWQRFVDTFPFPLDKLTTAATFDDWRKARVAGQSEGYYPVILAPEPLYFAESPPRDALAVAKTVVPDPDELVRRRLIESIFFYWAESQPTQSTKTKNTEYLLAELDRSEYSQASPERINEMRSEYGAALDTNPYEILIRNFPEFKELPTPPSDEEERATTESLILKPDDPPAIIARLPIAESWHVPICLNLGGWNAMPRSEELAAWAKRWKHLYGADIARVTLDTITFWVERPPATFEAAKQLYLEFFLTGAENLDGQNEMIADLRSTRYWTLWWD